MKTKLLYSMLVVVAISLASCNDDQEKPKTVPEVTTAVVTDISTNSAMVGGEIISDGNSAITVTGVVYSRISTIPTLDDEKIELTDTDGDFSTLLHGLNSGTTYHVRAFATNSIGTGYGEVVDFTTGNAAPLATNVSIAGETEVNKILTATYTYSDPENDAESGSIFKWYMANDGIGTGETLITGATGLTYTIQDEAQGKYIRFGVTPKSATGSTTGIEVKSPFVGAIGEATTVTFIYNGQEVTYGIINSDATGRKWLDRNLGAPNVANAVNNYQNYGDMFQWGRAADGHQFVTRTGTANTDMVGVNTTTELSSVNNPAHSLFILAPNPPSDWRSPENTSLWQGVNGTNNPCPSGWRIPTREEWAAENITSISDGFTKLKLTHTSFRGGADGVFSSLATQGHYWTSTVDADLDATRSIRIRYTTSYNAAVANRANGLACRCIKD